MDAQTSTSPKKLERKAILAQLALCPPLPSLGSINQALQELLQVEQRYSTQIAEVIRRDPSLTARLLRLVNSVYYGLSTPVTSIEEAVFYLGTRQIQQLTMVTPIIEDFQRLTRQCPFPWREFWQHCIGTAMLAPEVLGSVQAPGDESAYLAGLVHDVGKLVLAQSFPEHFAEVHRQAGAVQRDLVDIEAEVLGMAHTDLGALYLQEHGLPDLMVEVARCHHRPELAQRHRPIVAAVQVADLLLRNARIGHSGNELPVSREQCLAASGWQVLFPTPAEAEQAIVRAALRRSLERLPGILEGLV